MLTITTRPVQTFQHKPLVFGGCRVGGGGGGGGGITHVHCLAEYQMRVSDCPLEG